MANDRAVVAVGLCCLHFGWTSWSVSVGSWHGISSLCVSLWSCLGDSGMLCNRRLGLCLVIRFQSTFHLILWWWSLETHLNSLNESTRLVSMCVGNGREGEIDWCRGEEIEEKKKLSPHQQLHSCLTSMCVITISMRVAKWLGHTAQNKKSSIDYGEIQFRRFMSRTDGFKIRLEKYLAEKIVCVVKKNLQSHLEEPVRHKEISSWYSVLIDSLTSTPVPASENVVCFFA